MKSQHIRLIIVAFITLLVESCSIDNVQPINSITEVNVVTDEASAQRLLNGIYAKWRGFWPTQSIFITDILGDALVPTFTISGTTPNLINNNVLPDNRFVTSYYGEMYTIVNNANWLIQALEQNNAVGISEIRKNELLAEAKFHRAMAHFYLLRLFGQFYDDQSQLGIVIRTVPSETIVTATRNTVQDSYAAIVDDLQFASANAPTGVEHTYISQITAEALLAKVYLYMGDYNNAANKALSVINNTEGYALEINYSDIFLNQFNSSEVLFAPFVDGSQEASNSTSTISRTRQSFNLEQLADNQVVGPGDLQGVGNGYDPRFLYTYSEATMGNNSNGKYPYDRFGESNRDNTIYYLRMGELYLIYAEAKARSVLDNTADTDAVTRLNQIRMRAGVSDLSPTTKAELLTAIYNEKMLELFAEYGEHWFDIVRFDRLGDIDASNVKPTITNADKLIMPIPLNARVGNNALTQNPGY